MKNFPSDQTGKVWCMWMVKAKELAPFWGVAFTKRDMLQKLREKGGDDCGRRVVRVLVTELINPTKRGRSV
ncbi:MAG: hypothetical protein HRJ53_25065 [Acidobacteria bacterium Pan2503]|uniref:Uncharacterized protein n=1 Tax=Candidatus Acidiferrum panamense TaxID=2741543 RepID=A0A7V8NVM1_9BACT|nr:hypothetical protein [Candidatus Acidoferrum panamensis]